MFSSKEKKAIKMLKCMAYSSKIPLKEFRTHLEDTLCVSFLPNTVEKKEYVLNGITCDLLIPEMAADKRLILYVHGGNFIAGSRSSWRNMCASISHESATRIILPEYRLAPEYPFPCALEDIFAVYEHLTKKERKIIIAGDGSGASIVLAVMHKIMQTSLPHPKALVLISPWVSMQEDSPLFHKKGHSDPILSSENLISCAESYTYKSNRKNPLVSPLETNLNGFPPLYIQAAENELCISDTYEIQKRARQADLQCRLDIYQNLWYCFQMTHEYTGEAQKAIVRIGSYIREI